MNIFINAIKDFVQYDFLLYALIGTLLLSITCGIISPMIIARRNAFMGSAISHSTLLGVAIASSLFQTYQTFEIFSLTLIITMICTLFLSYSTFRQRLPSETLIGIFYTSTMAIGIIIHSAYAKNKSDLLSFLFGNVLLLNKEDLYLSFSLLLITALVILIPFKKWIFITYDEESAITSGVKAKRYHYLFFSLLCLLIVTSIKLAGTILVETLLLVPGFFALKFAKNIKQTFFLSITFSSFVSIIGICLANFLGFPSGATLAVVLFLFLVLSLTFKKLLFIIKKSWIQK